MSVTATKICSASDEAVNGVDSSFPLNPCRIDVINCFGGGLSCISCCHSRSLSFLHFCDAIILQMTDSLPDRSKFLRDETFADSS